MRQERGTLLEYVGNVCIYMVRSVGFHYLTCCSGLQLI